MYTVTQIAKDSGITPHTVRHYSRIGLLRPNRNPENGYRTFSPNDKGRLQFIRRARLLGFSLDEVAEIFRLADLGKMPCVFVRASLDARIAANRREIERLKKLQKRMERAQRAWAVDTDPASGDTICQLIESFENSA